MAKREEKSCKFKKHKKNIRVRDRKIHMSQGRQKKKAKK